MGVSKGRAVGVVMIAGLIFTLSGVASAMPGPGWHDEHPHGKHHSDNYDQGKRYWGHGNWGGDMGSGYMTARLRMVWNLNLTQKQREKIRVLQRELRGDVWEIEDKIEDISDELMSLYQAKTRDAKKIGAVYGKIFDLRRQKIERMIEGGNAVEDVLTQEQKDQLRKMRPNHPGWGSGWGED